MNNISIVRGVKQTVNITVEGDHSARLLSFVVKSSQSLTADRLIQKESTVITELFSVYDSAADQTIITIILLPADTQDLSNDVYYYDIDSLNPIDSDDLETVIIGQIDLTYDVQTPSDGSSLPTTAARYQFINASDGAVGDTIVVRLVDGVKTFVFEAK